MTWARDAAFRALTARARRLEVADLAHPTLVVAPHPDDETLGCGGTILRLRDAGVPVTLAFVTSGNRSHAGRMAPALLAARREAEARRAAAVLGVAPQAVEWLGLDDGKLAAHRGEAAERLAVLLARCRPGQVLLPYGGEAPADHRAARAATLDALAATGQRPRLLEYPVWFWNHWPWCRPARPARLAAGCRDLVRLFRHFRHVVDVGAVLDRKCAALACHASQTRRLVPPGWAVLGDVAGGDWLARFFTGHEFFHLEEVGR